MSVKENLEIEIQNLVNALGIKKNEVEKLKITLHRQAKNYKWNAFDEVSVLFSWRIKGGYSVVSALSKSLNNQPVHDLTFDREVSFDSQSAKSQVEVAMKRLGDVFQNIRQDSAVSNLCRILDTDEYVIHQILIEPNNFVFSFGNKSQDFVLIKPKDATLFKKKSYEFEVHVNGYDDNFYYSPTEYEKKFGLVSTTEAITKVREQFLVL